MADYVLSAKGTYDGSNFNKGIAGSNKALDSFVSKCQSIGGKITRAVGKVASATVKVMGVVGTFASGAFIKGGIDRALNIEQAQFKLKQMGMDVESVMASCSTAVDGTAFSLASAATSASMLGSSGVQAGDQMTRSLQAATGIAALGGVEMERVSQVFSKIAAKGKVQGDELMQMSEMGVNATDALAKHLGKTQNEVRDLVSKGKIDFQTFSDAMYETFGEAAYGANATFSGAMSNVGAALSRVSAKFADPALQGLKSVFQAMIPAINAVSSALDPVVAAFAKFTQAVSERAVAGINKFTGVLKDTGSFALSFAYGLQEAFKGTAVAGFFDSVSDAMDSFFKTMGDGGSKVDALKSALGSLCSGMGKWITEAFDGTPIGRFITWLQGCIKLFQMGATPIEGFRLVVANLKLTVSRLASSDGVSAFVDGVKEKVAELPQPLQNVIAKVSEFAAAVAGKFSGIPASAGIAVVAFAGVAAKFGGPLASIVKAVSGVGPKINGAMQAVYGLGSAFMSAGGGVRGLATVLGAFVSPVGLVVAAVAALAAAFAAMMATNSQFRDTVVDIVSQIGSSLAPVLSIVGQSLAALASTVLPMLGTMVQMLVPVLAQIVMVVLQIVAAIAPLVTTLVSILVPIITEIIQLVVTVAAEVLAAVLPVVSMILTAIQSAMPIIQAIVTAVMTSVLDVVQTVWPVVQAVISAVMSVIQGVIQRVWPIIETIITTVMAAIQDVINIVTAAISGDWEGVWNGIKDLFSDIWDGIQTAARQGIDAVLDIVTGIKDSITGFFSDAGSWLCDAGANIVSGLWGGIKSSLGWLGEQLGGIGGFIAEHKGPKQYDLKLLVPNGGWIMESLSTGLKNGEGGLVKTLGHITDTVSDWSFGADISYTTSAEDHGRSSGVAAANYYSFGDITIDASSLKDIETAADFADALVKAGRRR